MSRITSCTTEARITGCLATVLAITFCSCGPNEPRDNPKLFIVPSEAHPSDWLVAVIRSDEVNLSDCNQFTTKSLVFSNRDASQSQIEVNQVELTPDKDALRAEISLDGNAAIGDYNVELSCTSSIKLMGDFSVTEPVIEPEFSINPQSLETGERNAKLTFTALKEKKIFDRSSNTKIIFGDGAYITVLKLDVLAEDKMVVWVDVLSATPLKKLDVSVFSGSIVSRGQIKIISGNPSKIWIDGDSTFFRPRTNDPQPLLSYDITVKGELVNFVDGSTTVSFPLSQEDIASPGISVNEIKVKNSQELEVKISISDLAYVGAKTLRVTTKNSFDDTQIVVKARDEDPVLQLSPKTIPKGAFAYPVLMTARNFVFEPGSSIECLDKHCAVKPHNFIKASKQFVIEVTIDSEFVGESATLKLGPPKKGATPLVRESLIVTSSKENIAVKPQNGITQGSQHTGVEFLIEGGLFDKDASIHTLDRSGIRVASSNIGGNGTILNVYFDVAKDAPVGPALVEIDNNGQVLEAYVTVEASKKLWIEVSPTWIPQGRSIASIEVIANGFEFDELNTSILFDDPAFKVHSFQVDKGDPTKAVLTVEISPIARADTTVIYVEIGEIRTAATVRIFDTLTPKVVKVIPSEIARLQQEFTQNVTIEIEDMDLGATVAELIDGVSMDITDVTVENPQKLNVSMQIQPKGPVGWTGILIRSDWNSFVAPIYISGGGSDYSMTMTTDPQTVFLGSGSSNRLTLTLPFKAKFEGISDVSTGLADTYTTLPEINDTDKSIATTDVDVAFDIDLKSEVVPIFAIADKGAAVGMVNIMTPNIVNLDDEKPWHDTLAKDETTLLEINQGYEPHLVYSSTGNSSFGSAEFELVYSNKLDTAPKNNFSFIWDNLAPPHLVRISQSEDSKDKSVDAKLKSIGKYAGVISENPDPYDYDPCYVPFLGKGFISRDLDSDRIVISKTTCRLVVAATARSIVNSPWITPDLWLESEDNTSTGWPTPAASDPKLYLRSNAKDIEINVGAELGTTGYYLINIRQPYVIREIRRSPTEPYIKIETEPGTTLENLLLDLIDAQKGSTIASLSFLGLSVDNDGIIKISGVPAIDADIIHDVALLPDKSAFVLKLSKAGSRMDTVKVGLSGVELGEGDPIDASDESSFLWRIDGIDTNDNKNDFVVTWIEGP